MSANSGSKIIEMPPYPPSNYLNLKARRKERWKFSHISLISVVIFIIFSAQIPEISSICVWQGGGGFRLACGFKQSGLFRMKSLGGLKGWAGAGFTIGDEDGFKDSLTNTENKPNGQNYQNVQNSQFGQRRIPLAPNTPYRNSENHNNLQMSPRVPAGHNIQNMQNTQNLQMRVPLGPSSSNRNLDQFSNIQMLPQIPTGQHIQNSNNFQNSEFGQRGLPIGPIVNNGYLENEQNFEYQGNLPQGPISQSSQLSGDHSKSGLQKRASLWNSWKWPSLMPKKRQGPRRMPLRPPGPHRNGPMVMNRPPYFGPIGIEHQPPPPGYFGNVNPNNYPSPSPLLPEFSPMPDIEETQISKNNGQKPYGLSMLEKSENYGKKFRVENEQIGYDTNLFPDIHFTTTTNRNKLGLGKEGEVQMSEHDETTEAIMKKLRLKKIKLLKKGHKLKLDLDKNIKAISTTENVVTTTTTPKTTTILTTTTPRTTTTIPTTTEQTTQKKFINYEERDNPFYEKKEKEMTDEELYEIFKAKWLASKTTTSRPDYGENMYYNTGQVENYKNKNLESEKSKTDFYRDDYYRSEKFNPTEGSYAKWSDYKPSYEKKYETPAETVKNYAQWTDFTPVTKKPTPNPEEFLKNINWKEFYDPRYPPNHEININRLKMLAAAISSTTQAPVIYNNYEKNYKFPYGNDYYGSGSEDNFEKIPQGLSTTVKIQNYGSDGSFVKFDSRESRDHLNRTKAYNNAFYTHFNKSALNVPSPTPFDYFSAFLKEKTTTTSTVAPFSYYFKKYEKSAPEYENYPNKFKNSQNPFESINIQPQEPYKIKKSEDYSSNSNFFKQSEQEAYDLREKLKNIQEMRSIMSKNENLNTKINNFSEEILKLRDSSHESQNELRKKALHNSNWGKNVDFVTTNNNFKKEDNFDNMPKKSPTPSYDEWKNYVYSVTGRPLEKNQKTEAHKSVQKSENSVKLPYSSTLSPKNIPMSTTPPPFKFEIESKKLPLVDNLKISESQLSPKVSVIKSEGIVSEFDVEKMRENKRSKVKHEKISKANEKKRVSENMAKQVTIALNLEKQLKKLKLGAGASGLDIMRGILAQSSEILKGYEKDDIEEEEDEIDEKITDDESNDEISNKESLLDKHLKKLNSSKSRKHKKKPAEESFLPVSSTSEKSTKIKISKIMPNKLNESNLKTSPIPPLRMLPPSLPQNSENLEYLPNQNIGPPPTPPTFSTAHLNEFLNTQHILTDWNLHPLPIKNTEENNEPKNNKNSEMGTRNTQPAAKAEQNYSTEIKNDQVAQNNNFDANLRQNNNHAEVDSKLAQNIQNNIQVDPSRRGMLQQENFYENYNNRGRPYFEGQNMRFDNYYSPQPSMQSFSGPTMGYENNRNKPMRHMRPRPNQRTLFMTHKMQNMPKVNHEHSIMQNFQNRASPTPSTHFMPPAPPGHEKSGMYLNMRAPPPPPPELTPPSVKFSKNNKTTTEIIFITSAPPTPTENLEEKTTVKNVTEVEKNIEKSTARSSPTITEDEKELFLKVLERAKTHFEKEKKVNQSEAIKNKNEMSRSEFVKKSQDEIYRESDKKIEEILKENEKEKEKLKARIHTLEKNDIAIKNKQLKDTLSVTERTRILLNSMPDKYEPLLEYVKNLKHYENDKVQIDYFNIKSGEEGLNFPLERGKFHEGHHEAPSSIEASTQKSNNLKSYTFEDLALLASTPQYKNVFYELSTPKNEKIFDDIYKNIHKKPVPEPPTTPEPPPEQNFNFTPAPLVQTLAQMGIIQKLQDKNVNEAQMETLKKLIALSKIESKIEDSTAFKKFPSDTIDNFKNILNSMSSTTTPRSFSVSPSQNLGIFNIVGHGPEHKVSNSLSKISPSQNLGVFSIPAPVYETNKNSHSKITPSQNLGTFSVVDDGYKNLNQIGHRMSVVEPSRLISNNIQSVMITDRNKNNRTSGLNVGKESSNVNMYAHLSSSTLEAIKELALKKIQSIAPSPLIALPQQTAPEGVKLNENEEVIEKNENAIEPIEVDLSPMLSLNENNARSIEVDIPKILGTKEPVVIKRARLIKVRNAPKSYYPGDLPLSFEGGNSDIYTDFTCEEQNFFPGLYADPANSCKVFHLCARTDSGYLMKSFRCPKETVFDQEVLRCNWSAYVNCNGVDSKYHFNKYLSQSFQFLKSLNDFSSLTHKNNSTLLKLQG